MSNSRSVWFPYTQMKNAPLPLKVVNASGCTLFTESGLSLLDLTSSWWCMCHGYKHPKIISAIIKQSNILPHVMMGNIYHTQVQMLADNLVSITPKGLNHVFFADSGSVAVELALKIAFQYWNNIDQLNKNRFVYFNNAYHGDTMGCMSVSDASTIHGTQFSDYVPKHVMLQLPTTQEGLRNFRKQLNLIKYDTAAVIIEPILQAAGGMKFHSAYILHEVAKITKELDILLIADEVATGFCRLGSMFACDEANVVPDILVLGKGLTGGHCPLATTLVTTKIFEAFLSDSYHKALMHGPTFTGYPIACATANASIELFSTEPRIIQIQEIEKIFATTLSDFNTLPCVKQVRYKGAVGIIELYHSGKMKEIVSHCITNGILIRPLGNVIYIMPPFIITNTELNFALATLYEILNNQKDVPEY